METKKQTSWFKTDVKFENSFKFWFALQWQNSYIQLFIVGFIVTLLELFNLGWVKETVANNFAEGGNFGGIATVVAMLILPIEASTIAFKGFYQFWRDIKNGRSR